MAAAFTMSAHRAATMNAARSPTSLPGWAKESVFKSFTLTANGMLTRNEAFIELTGDNAVAHIAGACCGRRGFPP